ncbi:phosphotransferase family protein [Saccharomonospora azurea]|uniref:phosphotransferase family protein n=1 Tax=Saccharomonospora azurea TaxID=40988 RepID=UPI003D8D499E
MAHSVKNEWIGFFRDIGYAKAALLGQGMEGVVYKLDADLVGKVWHSRQLETLRPLRDFYAELAGQRLSFNTPEIVAMHDKDGVAVTVERHLTGQPLRDKLDSGEISVPAALDATVSVVAALRGTTAGAAARGMAVLDEARPLWEGCETWPAALAGLVQRRAERFADVLRRSVTEFDRKLDSVLSLLHSLPDVEPQFVHGDICPENILVDSSGAPTALLDWGFVTTAGDNAFEASCAAGFFDMYGPDARSVDDTLVRRFADELGHPVELQLLYRAAYAIAGANSYGADGADGHFMWCAAALNRDDVTERLLTAAV